MKKTLKIALFFLFVFCGIISVKAKTADTITFTLKKASYTGKEITATVKAKSGLKVTLAYYSDSTCKTKTTTTNATKTGGAPKNAGTYYAIGKTAGNTTYKSATSSCTKAVTISKATDSMTFTLKKASYTGKEITPTVKTKSGLKATLTYYSDSTCKTKTTTTNAAKTGGAPKNAGTYYAIGSTEGNTNYNKVTSKCTKVVTISKVNDSITFTFKKVNYTGKEIDAAVATKSGIKVGLNYYSDSACKKKTTTTNPKITGVPPKNVGTYYAIGSTAGNTNYNKATSSCTKVITISKVNDSITFTLKKANYTGKEINTTVTSKSGLKVTLTYYSDSTCKTKTTTTNATKIGGAPKNIGTYYAIGTVAGDANYNKVTSLCTKAITISKGKAKITCTNKVYNGENQSIAKCSGGTVSNATKKMVGSYTIKCKGDSNHTDADSILCSISSASLNNVTVSSISEQKYTGKQILPNPTVKIDSKTLVKDKDYTVNYSDNVKVGTAKITINGISGYKGSKTVTFKISDNYSVKFYGAATIETNLPPTITLKGNVDTPIFKSKTLKLKTNTDYVVSFNYKVSSGNNKFSVDLYPDNLPQISATATSTTQHKDWIINSSINDITNCNLRFFDSSHDNDEKDITITNVMMGTVKTVAKKYGATIGALPTPTRNNFTFLGWYTELTGGTKVTSSTVVKKNMNLYPHWKAKEVRIYYNVAGGTQNTNYKLYNGYISKDGKSNFYQVVNPNANQDLYNYTTFGLTKKGYELYGNEAWCISSGKCFNQDTAYAYDYWKSIAVDKGDFYEIVMKANWKKLRLVDSYVVGSNYEVLDNKSYSGTTLKYKTIRQKNATSYYALIWVADANKQINSANNNMQGAQRPYALNTEIKAKGYGNKAIIAVNGSFTWNSRANIPVIASNGNIVKNTKYQTWRMNGNKHESLRYGILAVDKNGKLIHRGVDEKFLLNPKTTQEKLSDAGYQDVEKWLKDNGARNDWAVHSYVTGGWKDGAINSDYRTMLCQVDEHNFVLSVGYRNSIEGHMKELHNMFGCTIVVNLDGGGSSGMYYKLRGSNSMSSVYQYTKDSRTIADILYFIEQ